MRWSKRYSSHGSLPPRSLLPLTSCYTWSSSGEFQQATSIFSSSLHNCSFEPYSELYAFQCLWYPSAIVEWFDFPINDEFGSCTNTIHILRNDTNDKPHLLCFPWIKTMADLLWLQKEKMPVIIILEHLQESYFRGWSAVAAAVWPAFFITCAFRNQPSTNRNHRSFLIHLCSWCEYNLQ